MMMTMMMPYIWSIIICLSPAGSIIPPRKKQYRFEYHQQRHTIYLSTTNKSTHKDIQTTYHFRWRLESSSNLVRKTASLQTASSKSISVRSGLLDWDQWWICNHLQYHIRYQTTMHRIGVRIIYLDNATCECLCEVNLSLYGWGGCVTGRVGGWRHSKQQQRQQSSPARMAIHLCIEWKKISLSILPSHTRHTRHRHLLHRCCCCDAIRYVDSIIILYYRTNTKTVRLPTFSITLIVVILAGQKISSDW